MHECLCLCMQNTMHVLTKASFKTWFQVYLILNVSKRMTWMSARGCDCQVFVCCEQNILILPLFWETSSWLFWLECLLVSWNSQPLGSVSSSAFQTCNSWRRCSRKEHRTHRANKRNVVNAVGRGSTAVQWSSEMALLCFAMFSLPIISRWLQSCPSFLTSSSKCHSFTVQKPFFCGFYISQMKYFSVLLYERN